MKLKKLEIQGFKSFADKTVLEFDQNITGIVGPNGCGKSNVVDAIRWVMGEQSVKNLRGKAMEDIIFAGAQDRSPGSLASVELTFENDGGEVPAQYMNCQEISIGRKLFRTGESEYYINKQPARLKDVKDFFLGTGVGTKAYSIIEQGRIGQIVTAKPEERRSFIDEAAGVSKFQARKAEATRRMNATEQNLLRLKDILAELERQKNSLQRQARKAEKFKVIRDELREADLKVSSYDYKNSQDKQKELLQKIKDTDQVQLELNNQISELENTHEEKRLNLAEMEAEVGDLQQKVYERDNELQLAESKLNNKKEEEQRLQREIEESQNRILDLQRRIEILSENEEKAVSNHGNSNTEVETLEAEVEAQAEKLEVMTAEAEELFGQMENYRSQRALGKEKLFEVETKSQSAFQRLDEYHQRSSEIEQEAEEVGQKYQQLSRLLKSSQGSLSDMKQMKLELAEQAEQMEVQVLEVEETLQNEKTDLENIKEQLLNRKSRLQSLQELERNFEGYQDGPRTVLRKKQNGELSSVKGSVTQFIETDSDYEGAVSAVLGEQSQYMVVDNAQAGMDCAGLLKSENAGRGSFVSMNFLNEIDEPHTRELTSLNDCEGLGVKGYLEDYVRVQSGYEKLKDMFFKDYVLVDGIQNAMEVWHKVKMPVVTTDGEVISRKGVLSGGSFEKTSKALLEKKREIRELEGVVSELINQVKAKEEVCFDLNRKLKTLKAELERMKASRHEEDIRLTKQEKDIQHFQNELEGLNKKQQKYVQEKINLRNKMDELTDHICELAETEVEHKAKYNEAIEFVDSHEEEEQSFRREIAVLGQDLNQNKIKLAQAREQLTFLAKELERMASDRVQMQDDLARAEQQNAEALESKIFTSEQITFLGESIQELLQLKVEIDKTFAEKKEEFDQLNNVMMEEEIKLRHLRKDFEEVKDVINQSTISLTEVRGEVSRLHEQVLERYQVSLQEICDEHYPQEEDFDYFTTADRVKELRGKMASAGHVNLDAIDELKEVSERFEFLNKQKVDLEDSLQSLEQAIQKINETTKVRFQETFEFINERFQKVFPKLFEGGRAELRLTDPENMLETGVDIIAQPPGKKQQNISLLSGGEKALTAVSLLFAIFLIKPSPFCLLDEVDAPLDDANVDRYNDIVREMSQRTQFIVITHNKRTMQVTDALFGVTMQKMGVSQLVSVNLNEDEKE